MENTRHPLFAFLICAGLLSCSEPATNPEPPAVETATTAETPITVEEISTPAGAGSVTRVDPALDALVPVDAVIEKLAGDLQFTEGPLWLSDSNQLVFSDVPGNAIYTWSEADGLGTLLSPVYEGDQPGFIGSNGLLLDQERRLLILEHGNHAISRLEEDGSRTTLVDNYGGMRLNSPNDAVMHTSGWIYFTDPPYGLVGQDESPLKELPYNGIYRMSPEGDEIELLNSEQTRPNGIAFSPDESILYVANSDGAHQVWYAYPVLADGALGSGEVFYDVTDQTESGGADGMKVDADGNIFATGPGGVWVFSPEGTHLGTIKPDEVPANIAWGDDGSTLYMTARTGLYRIRLATAGQIQ